MKKRDYIFLVLFFFDSYGLSFDQINLLIKKYKRPITFLAVMNNYKDIESFMQHNNGVFVLLNSQFLSESKSWPSNFVHLRRNANENDLRYLGYTEHFDIAIVEGHVKRFNLNYVRTLYNLAENVFVIISDNEKKLISYFVNGGFENITTRNKKLIFYSYHRIRFLRRTHWLEVYDAGYSRYIFSDYFEKKYRKLYPTPKDFVSWVPGINLMTFKMLNGNISSYAQLQNEINRLFAIEHYDWMPNNIIMQGNHLELIDFDDKFNEPKTVKDEQMLALMHDFVKKNNRLELVTTFDAILDYCRAKIHPDSANINNGGCLKILKAKGRYNELFR